MLYVWCVRIVAQTKASLLETMWAHISAALSAPTTVAVLMPDGIRSEDQMSADKTFTSVVGGQLITIEF